MDRNYAELPSEPIMNYAYHNQGHLDFINMTQEWGFTFKGFTNGFSFGDLDNDGDLDAVLNNLGSTAILYENQTDVNLQHFLQVRLKGPASNPFGLGAKATLSGTDFTQSQELTLTRGFQSSVAPVLHFGLGSQEETQKLRIDWPDGYYQELENIQANQVLTIDYKEANSATKAKKQSKPPFQLITNTTKIDFQHQEDPYNDFEEEPLLPHKNSTWGPPIAVADVNGDQLEDFFVGNASGSSARLYIQLKDGTFIPEKGPWEADFNQEDTGALFFDPDGDGDQDLYVVSGDNQPNQPSSYYQDRYYINTPEGFVKSESGFTGNYSKWTGDCHRGL